MEKKTKIDKEFLKFSNLYNSEFFIFQAFSYLRLHREVWEDAEYLKLYEECLEYLQVDLLQKLKKDGVEIKNNEREFVMVATDMFACCYKDEFTVTEELLKSYLEFRKTVWNGTL